MFSFLRRRGEKSRDVGLCAESATSGDKGTEIPTKEKGLKPIGVYTPDIEDDLNIIKALKELREITFVRGYGLIWVKLWRYTYKGNHKLVGEWPAIVEAKFRNYKMVDPPIVFVDAKLAHQLNRDIFYVKMSKHKDSEPFASMPLVMNSSYVTDGCTVTLNFEYSEVIGK